MVFIPHFTAAYKLGQSY